MGSVNAIMTERGEDSWVGRRNRGFPGSSAGKQSTCNTGDPDSIPGSGRSPGGGNGNPLQYSSWEIPRSEETGRLQSVGLQRVRRDLAIKQSQVYPKTSQLHESVFLKFQ